ncbi:MAG: glutamine cyclotransferase [Bryobacterales bacterium]|nr:glutamine cyclotransferase [Bryobacterales bacterium]
MLQSPAVPTYRPQVIHVYPHDREAFTQGLEYRDGFLFEGTGLKGHSTVRKEELESGRVLQKIDIADQYFGEGITVFQKSIVELTWQSHTGLVYDKSSFGLLKSFSYSGEGWGLANDGQRIYMSDGTAQIRVLDPETLTEQRRITVHERNKQFDSLNELEWVRGEIFANVWQTDQILRISPRDGAVTGVIDLSGLLSREEREAGADVLNGIAYDSAGDRLFVTGKLWPKLFEIKLIPKV